MGLLGFNAMYHGHPGETAKHMNEKMFYTAIPDCRMVGEIATAVLPKAHFSRRYKP